MNYRDIALHVAGAAALMLVPPVIVNTVFWPAREAIQHWPRPWEIFTRPQSLAEWLAPVVAGLLIYAAA